LKGLLDLIASRLLAAGPANWNAAPLNSQQMSSPPKWRRSRFQRLEYLRGSIESTHRKGPNSRKDMQTCGIDPIIEKLRKNSLDRVSPQASEFPVINAERESASEYSKA
jgi:hypothetical protein